MAIKIRRGLDADRLLVVFDEGEIVYTTDTKSVYIGDGVTLGGNPVGSVTYASIVAALGYVPADDAVVVKTTNSYSNPSWLTSLSWSKISGTPTTLSGYGITDGVVSSRTLTINGVGYDLTANRSWTIAPGGTIGQILAKNSSTNYDWNWIDNYTEDIRDTVKATQTINKGQAVYISGANGTNQLVALADYTGELTSSQTIGIAFQNLATNAIGQIITQGILSGINTSAATAGDPIYLGANGNLIFGYANKPHAPNHLVYIGVVTRSHAINGEIFVKIQNGYELEELHNVLISSVANNQGLFYESSTSLWKNKSIATVLGYTPADDAVVVKTFGSYANPSWITSLAWSKITGAPAFLTAAITSLNGLTGATQTFVNDTNVTIVSAGTTHTLTWSGTLADSRIASATNWNTAYTNRITSLTTTGSSGAATLVSNVLNIPNYTLSGLGGQPLNANLTSISALTYASLSFVKMTAAGTFALDTNTYLTAESDTLNSVTGRGNSTANAITVGNLIVNGTIQNTIGSANLYTSNVLGTLNISLHAVTPTTGNYFLRTDTQTLFLNAPASGGSMIFRLNNTTYGQYFATTGNFTLQNGGTFTDAGYRLDVNGTVRIQNQLTTTGSITAASAIARGVYMNNTLVAAANNDVLVGLDINPTFTNGSFTGVTNTALRATGTILLNSNNVGLRGKLVSGTEVTIALIDSSNNYAWGTPFNGGGSIFYTANDYLWYQYPSSTLTQRMRLFGATGNLLIQNGGTFTDNGFRLEVVGTARVTNTLTLGNLASDPTGSNGMIYYNTTLNVFRVYQSGAWKTITAI